METSSSHAERGPLVILADSIALMRPTLLIPLWTMHLLGALHATGWTIGLPSLRLLGLSAGHTALLAGMYVLNQWTDAETDADNEKLFLVADGIVSRRHVAIETGVLTLLGLSIAGAFALRAEMLRDVGLLFGASLVLGVAYSVPPLRLKARAGWDLLANAVGYGAVAFAVGWVAGSPLGLDTWMTATPYVLSVAATFVFTTIPDVPGDRAAGLRTTGVLLGKRGTALFGFGLLLLATVSATLLRNVPAFVASLAALPLYGLSAIRFVREGEDPHLTRTTQIAILALTVVAAVGRPIYLVWLIVVVGWVRRYYRHRFGMRYP